MIDAMDVVRYTILLKPEEINRFVGAATRCEFDVDIAYNHFVVDAKSIVGVFGLDLRRPLTVVCHGYDSRFDSYLRHLEAGTDGIPEGGTLPPGSGIAAR